MPRKLPPFVQKDRSRHGTLRFYFRRGKGPRIRLPDLGSAEFDAAYASALKGEQAPVLSKRVDPKSVRWLVDRYRESSAWRGLSDATHYQRDNLFAQMIDGAGNADFRDIDRKTIRRVIEKRAETPAQANSLLKALRGLFEWAMKNEHVAVNPCIGVDRIKFKSDGFPPWTADDVVSFRTTHAIGSRARLAMEFMLLTGIRRADMAGVGRQHIKGGVLTLRTSKTGAVVTIALPKYLTEIIDATPATGLHLISQDSGKPYTVESFGNNFRDWCDEACVTKSAHGLRKLSATLAAEGGAAAHELMAQYGWTKIAQAEIYTKGADRVRLGMKASAIVAGQIGNIATPSPISGCGAESEKPSKIKAAK